MKSIQVSVIIPAYNRAQLLVQTLKSLLYQDYPATMFEVIVVDNNSSDNTRELVKDFIQTHANELNVKYTIEKRQGDIYARHTGAYHAEGDVLIFTDDDATFDANWIAEFMRVFDEFPQVGAVGSRILIKWDKTPPSWVVNYESLLGKISVGEDVIVREQDLFINNGSLAIKKAIFTQVKGNNPGQLGEFLIGDAEVGLCRKLHQQNIPIAFTDKTTMWHHQFVDKNGKLKDILRRVANNGIAEAYTYFIIEKKTSRRFFVKAFAFSFLKILKSLLSFNKKKIMNSILKYHQLKYFFLYIKMFQTNKKLLTLMNKNDWQFDENYHGSKLIFNNKIDVGRN